MTSAQLISWVVSAITFGTVIMFGCIGETINQKADDRVLIYILDNKSRATYF